MRSANYMGKSETTSSISSWFSNLTRRNMPDLSGLRRRLPDRSDVNRTVSSGIDRMSGMARSAWAPRPPSLANRAGSYADMAILVACGFMVFKAGEKWLRWSGYLHEEAGLNAAHEYDRGAQEFQAGGRVDQAVREAEQAVEGSEGESLKRAEQAGKRRSRGEDSTS